MKNYAARIGAALYVVWGLMHIMAAWGIHKLAATLPTTAVMPALRLEQAAWHMAAIAIATIAIAVLYNWRNHRTGYWANLIVASTTDIGFILLFLIPGHISWSMGMRGPMIWLLAVGFSTMGRFYARDQVGGT